MNKGFDEHDITKKMLNTIRVSKKIITENVDTSNDTIDVTGQDLKSEQNQFMDQITPRVDFTVFKLYPNANNAVFSGKFQDMNGMEFQMSLDETDGLYVSATNLQLTDEALNRLRALKGYYLNWVKDWANKLANEYKPNR